jgi:hypothetical protein
MSTSYARVQARCSGPAGSAPRTPVAPTSSYRLFALVVLTSLVLCFGFVARASGLSIGLVVGGEPTHQWILDENQWNAMQKSGIKLVHVMVRPGESGNTDTVFRLAAERGITILPYLYGFQGTSQYPYTLATGPAGNAWETWVYEAVERYGYNGFFWKEHPALIERPVPGWEVWNEPNLPPNSPGGMPNGKKYGEFLKRTASAIQAAQNIRTPGVGTQVYFGGLVPASKSIATFLNEAKAYRRSARHSTASPCIHTPIEMA